jgi:hypothetical protein
VLLSWTTTTRTISILSCIHTSFLFQEKTAPDVPAGIVGDNPLTEGFVSGFLLIFFSEIGDKTFFIALLLALRQPKSAVFAGTFGALAVMTVISVFLGQVGLPRNPREGKVAHAH